MSFITPATFNTPHFKWKDPFVTIRTTDSEFAQEPPALTETSVSLVSGDPRWHQKHLMWRYKLGGLLVHDYLAIDPGKYSEYDVINSKIRCYSNTNYVEDSKNYILAKFPKNYVFYVRQTTNTQTRKVRFDSYLVGKLPNPLFPLQTH
jgi:hypothetical protein